MQGRCKSPRVHMTHSSNDDKCFIKLYWHVLGCDQANIVGGHILVESINFDTIVLCEQIPRRGRRSTPIAVIRQRDAGVPTKRSSLLAEVKS